jgi:transcriptional regulator with XRE-family HTH domain
LKLVEKPEYVKLLVARRIELRLSQRALASRMNMVQSYICDLESGRYSIKLHTLEWWAKALELDLNVSLQPVSNTATNELRELSTTS